ncbi:MAG: DUF3310 domain-containing protein [Megasphaera sp.]|uniref:DUF3310 domain-containing protein n=1 Tax=Megasphaera sp. TaxID=2023260 RepID=UPI003F089D5A
MNKNMNTVWVNMDAIEELGLVKQSTHESGYAEIIGAYEAPNFENNTYTTFYDVRFRGSDETIHGVHEARLSAVPAQESTMHDKHYRDSVVEPILVMQELFSREELIGFLKGNILKYRLRAGHKGGEEAMKEDFDKIRVYEKWLKTIKNGERIEL